MAFSSVLSAAVQGLAGMNPAAAGAHRGVKTDTESKNPDKAQPESSRELVYQCLDDFPKGIEDLAGESRLAPEVLMSELVGLMLEGRAKEVSKNFYVRE